MWDLKSYMMFLLALALFNREVREAIGMMLACLLGLFWCFFGFITLGIWGYIELSHQGHDNWGSAALLLCLIIQFIPMVFLAAIGNSNSTGWGNGDTWSSGRQPYGTKKVYDSHGNVSGYIDK